MIGNTFRFAGFRDALQPPVMKPVGLNGRMAPVHPIKAADWDMVDKNSSVVHLKFPQAASEGYFRQPNPGVPRGPGSVPDNLAFLQEAGASVLNNCLGLEIVAPTVLAELDHREASLRNVYHKTEETVVLEGVGSLQERIIGKSIDDIKGPQRNQNLNAWVELFIYTFVGYDIDKEGRNVMQSADSSKKIASIDNEYSGNSPQLTELNFPISLKKMFGEHAVIPKAYREKLRTFVSHRKENSLKLLPYYTPQTIAGMFARAQWLIDHPQLDHPKVIHKQMMMTPESRSYRKLIDSISLAYNEMLGYISPRRARKAASSKI